MIPQVSILNAKKFEVPESFIKKASELFFEFLVENGIYKFKNPVTFTIVFTSKVEIQKYNLTYRNIDVPTDVLSFCTDFEKDVKTIDQSSADSFLEIGDIIICPEVIRENAMRFRTTYDEELLRIVVHGILHLLGYDHFGVLGELKEEIFKIQESFVEKYKEKVS